MATGPERSPRRTDPLSLERIVSAGVELLDGGGEAALTVRALSARLATGRGAIYHHVPSIEALMASATERITVDAIAPPAQDLEPGAALRALAAGLFDAIDRHPWVGTQLSRHPAQPAVFHLWTSVGSQLRRLGLSPARQADAGAALVNYVLGAAAQHAATARAASDPAARQAFLDDVAAAWQDQDRDDLVRSAADVLRDHDDRDQFLAGVDIYLTGIGADAAGRGAGAGGGADRAGEAERG